MIRALLTYVIVSLLAAACAQTETPATQSVTISVVGSNDVHGNLSQRDDRGGLTTLSGYVNALRAARDDDAGAVLLIDAGDMWQGTLESNLTEGAAVVAAFNALGYAAAAIGNHEFDFGPAGPESVPASPGDDPRGALKQRATEANFPFLAANLFDEASGAPVDWPNVRSSIMLDVVGINVGIIGVMTKRALAATIATNVSGLRIAPLAPVVEKEARLLRESGANLIIVTAHAGGRCFEFSDPLDLSSCNEAGEIFTLAKSLPEGLVNHIIAGHVHQGIAHIVNGIAITSSYSNTRAFSRVDFTFDTETSHILERRVYPPKRELNDTLYEGHKVIPDARVVAIAEHAAQVSQQLKNRKLGIHLATPFTLEGNPESTLGNLFTDALLHSFDADLAMHNVAGGLRQDLPQGDLTFGSVYELSPFENRVVAVDLSGAQLRNIVARQAHRGGRSIGFSGMRAFISCNAGLMTVELRLDDGEEVTDGDNLRVIINDYIAQGGDGVLAGIVASGDIKIDVNLPLTRSAFIKWLSDHGGSISASEYDTSGRPKWNRPESMSRECRHSEVQAK